MLIHMSTSRILKDFVKKRLPDKKYFYRSLKDGITDDNIKKLNGHITNEEYLTCIKIWKECNMKNIGDYPNHYLKKDVLSFADVFEKFTSMCLKFYKRDSCHYFNSPRLSWDEMLKMTEIRLE